ncbi:MAG: oligosaccharide flippase family protein, partial [Nitrososphaerales archaeon]
MTDKSFEKLARGSYYLILTSIVNLTIGALFWIVLAKITDPATLGQVMVVIAIATSVIGFAGYGVQVTISKYISEYNARNMIDNSRKVLQLGLKIALIVSGSAALCIALLSGHIASTAYQNPSLAPLIIFVVITYLPAQTVIASITGAFQGSHKMQYNFLTYLIYDLVRLAIAVTLVLYGLGSLGILIGFGAASIAVSLLGYTFMIPKVIPRSKSSTGEKIDYGVKHILTFSGLNYFSVGMRTLSAQIGVLILGTLNLEWAAFYGVSVLIANVVGGISLAVSKA